MSFTYMADYPPPSLAALTEVIRSRAPVSTDLVKAGRALAEQIRGSRGGAAEIGEAAALAAEELEKAPPRNG